MEIRKLVPEDAAACARLMAEAFEGGQRPAPVDENAKTKGEAEESSTTLGVFDGARLVAAVTIHDLHLVWGEAEAPMGGIAGVACAADQRGRGHVARLLGESLHTMQDSGQYLSGLYPFAFEFYKKHGWEWVGEKREQIVPTAQIKATPEGKSVRSYDGPEALEVVRPLYAEFASRHRGMATRRDPIPNFWDKALGHRDDRTTYVQVYHDPATGKAEGYLTFRYPDSGDTGQIGDFFATTPAAYRGLLSVVHYYGTQVPKVQFNTPANDPLPLYVMHWDLETKVRPLFMGRIVDVAAAFSALHPKPALSGKIVLQVADGQCEWNQQSFAVTLEAGHVSVTPTASVPGITLDIQALTQAYWGQPSLELLRAAGRLSVADEAQYALLSELLPPQICFINDFF